MSKSSNRRNRPDQLTILIVIINGRYCIAIPPISTERFISHIEWIKSMKSIQSNEYPGIKIGFPLISDSDLTISRKYGLLQNDLANARNIWESKETIRSGKNFNTIREQ